MVLGVWVILGIVTVMGLRREENWVLGPALVLGAG
jgi:hypothetical protein